MCQQNGQPSRPGFPRVHDDSNGRRGRHLARAERSTGLDESGIQGMPHLAEGVPLLESGESALEGSGESARRRKRRGSGHQQLHRDSLRLKGAIKQGCQDFSQSHVAWPNLFKELIGDGHGRPPFFVYNPIEPGGADPNDRFCPVLLYADCLPCDSLANILQCHVT